MSTMSAVGSVSERALIKVNEQDLMVSPAACSAPVAAVLLETPQLELTTHIGESESSVKLGRWEGRDRGSCDTLFLTTRV